MIPRLLVIYCNRRRKWTHAIRFVGSREHEGAPPKFLCHACGARVKVAW